MSEKRNKSNKSQGSKLPTDNKEPRVWNPDVEGRLTSPWAERPPLRRHPDASPWAERARWYKP